MCGLMVYCGDATTKISDLRASFQTISHRGPDRSCEWVTSTSWWGFHRLAIMGLSDKGDQPFINPVSGSILVCNGEVYNYKKLQKTYLAARSHHNQDELSSISGSDCAILLPYLSEFGLEQLCLDIDGEFAFVAFDNIKNQFLAARDPLGIRPLFYGLTADGIFVFASEMKALHLICSEIHPFPPGHWFDGTTFHCYLDLTEVSEILSPSLGSIGKEIHDLLTQAVDKRLSADVPIGFLLSGGLDSSLVCALAARSSTKPIRTFAIGMDGDAIDLKYAREMANFLKSDHHEVLMTQQEVIEALPHVIYQLETWDITTVRAAIGMYLVCKYVKDHTDVKVLLTGEVSDELFGYKYTDFAPDALSFQNESKKRVQELHYYDVLRADRCIAAHGIEARVPFSDPELVRYVMALDPELKMNTTGIGKFLLRMAFKQSGLLPESILMREKAAFSDAVGHSMVDILRAFAEEKYSDLEFAKLALSTLGSTIPLSKEALLYRTIFSQFFKGREDLIPAYWLPNREWAGCSVNDPSARYLSNYGKSGG